MVMVMLGCWSANSLFALIRVSVSPVVESVYPICRATCECSAVGCCCWVVQLSGGCQVVPFQCGRWSLCPFTSLTFLSAPERPGCFNRTTVTAGGLHTQIESISSRAKHAAAAALQQLLHEELHHRTTQSTTRREQSPFSMLHHSVTTSDDVTAARPCRPSLQPPLSASSSQRRAALTVILRASHPL